MGTTGIIPKKKKKKPDIPIFQFFFIQQGRDDYYPPREKVGCETSGVPFLYFPSGPNADVCRCLFFVNSYIAAVTTFRADSQPTAIDK